jgi:hypothetical protein
LDSQIQNASSTSTNAYKDLAANLTIAVTPQISSEGLITLDVLVNFEQFTSPANQNDVTSGNRTKKAISTSVIMGNNEVLALGGLIQDTVQDTVTKVPILGDIPILGNLFKNTVKESQRTSLLILILPEIIPTRSDADKITEDRILDTKAVFYGEVKQRDPLLRWFFKDQVRHGEGIIDDFVELKDKYIDESQYVRIEKPERLKKSPLNSLIDHLDDNDEPKIPANKLPMTPQANPSSQIMQMAQARFGVIDTKNNKDQEKAG